MARKEDAMRDSGSDSMDWSMHARKTQDPLHLSLDTRKKMCEERDEGESQRWAQKTVGVVFGACFERGSGRGKMENRVLHVDQNIMEQPAGFAYESGIISRVPVDLSGCELFSDWSW